MNEAADALVRCFTSECRRTTFAYFRERYGEQFAKQAAALAKPKLAAR